MEMTLQIVLTVVSTVITGAVGYLFHKLQKETERREADERERLKDLANHDKAVNDALRALCRDRILQGHRYYKRQGGISHADLETMTKLYNAYHDLGGNGTITAIYEKICDLPLKEGE